LLPIVGIHQVGYLTVPHRLCVRVVFHPRRIDTQLKLATKAFNLPTHRHVVSELERRRRKPREPTSAGAITPLERVVPPNAGKQCAPVVHCVVRRTAGQASQRKGTHTASPADAWAGFTLCTRQAAPACRRQAAWPLPWMMERGIWDHSRKNVALSLFACSRTTNPIRCTERIGCPSNCRLPAVARGLAAREASSLYLCVPRTCGISGKEYRQRARSLALHQKTGSRPKYDGRELMLSSRAVQRQQQSPGAVL
jgi:hypothetical protein